MNLRPLALAPAILPFLFAACGGNEAGPPPVVAPPLTTALPSAVASTEPAPPHPAFENPGGMWMPAQMAAHAAKLKELGLTIDPAQLADPTADPQSAVVSLGGCSAAGVSSDGLIVTNHHCVQGALQTNSTPEKNLIKDGYLAKTRADELTAGPTARVLVTKAVTDVTDQVLAGVDQIKDDLARFKKIETRQKELVAACEKDRPGIRCSVPSFYEGAQFFRIEQLEIRDVRLVYAPPAGIGNYGGEIDNWRWPRHAGDFSFYRAYVGKDGKPADFAQDNAPFHADHFLKIASTPLEEGDLVMIAGYPGRTYSLKTKPEVDEAVSWSYPRRKKFFDDYLATVDSVAGDPEVKIKANTLVRGLNNALTNTKGQLEGLVQGGLAGEKAKTDDALRAYIDGDPARKKEYGDLLGDIARVFGEHAKHRDADAEVRELATMPRLVGAATAIVRTAEERAKKDAERDPDYQERNWKRLEQAQVALEKGYNPKLDRALLVEALKRVRDEQDGGASPLGGPHKDVTPAFAKIMGAAKPTDDAIAKKVDAMYAATKIETQKARVDLLKTATTAQRKARADPSVKLAVVLRPFLKRGRRSRRGVHGADGALEAEVHQGAPRDEGGRDRPRRERHAPHHVRHRPRVQAASGRRVVPTVHVPLGRRREGDGQRTIRRTAGVARCGCREEARPVRGCRAARRAGRFPLGPSHHRRQLRLGDVERQRGAGRSRVRRQLRSDGVRLDVHAEHLAHHPGRHPVRPLGPRRRRARRQRLAGARTYAGVPLTRITRRVSRRGSSGTRSRRT